MRLVIHKLFNWKFVIFTVGGLLVAYGCMVFVLYIQNPSQFKYGTYIGTVSVEELRTDEAVQAVNTSLQTIPVTVRVESQELSRHAYDFGAEASADTVVQYQKQQRWRYALWPFSAPNQYQIPLLFNSETAQATLSQLMPKNAKKIPQNAQYAYTNNQTVTIVAEKTGQGVDANAIRDSLLQALENNVSPIRLDTVFSTVTPLVTSSILQAHVEDAQLLSTKSYRITSTAKTVVIPFADIAPLIIVRSKSLVLPNTEAKALASTYAQQLTLEATEQITHIYTSGKPSAIVQRGIKGQKVRNINAIALALQNGISEKTDVSVAAEFNDVAYTSKSVSVNDTNMKTYRYMVITWGTVKADLALFKQNANETLNSPLGWARAGLAFQEVSSGAVDFYLVLSEPSELPKRYPTICDATYSCRVGNYVIINDDRWRTATPAWTGSLRNYQHMVVNHETGHWLGHRHEYCPATGKPAPVMQQQSISLQGCTFNPWPLPYEIAST